MLKIFDINKYMVYTLVYKCVKLRISVCENCFRSYRYSYNARSSLGDPLFVPQYLVMHSRQSILYRGPKAHNDVPREIKLLNNPESFKYNLKILYNYFNSMFFLGETDVLEVFKIVDVMSH